MLKWLKVRLRSLRLQSRSQLRLAEDTFQQGRHWELAGHPDKAEEKYRQAIRLDPDHARAHNNLGCLLTLKGDFEDALDCYRQALRCDPEQPEANQNYATLSRDANARDGAIRGYVRKTQSDPADAGAFTGLANILSGSGRYIEALENLDRAIAIDPAHAEAHYARSLLLLTLGDYAAGWKEYEWRWRLGNLFSDPARRFSMPLWDGEPIAGGAILLHGELAYGESLQYVRYARLVAERCDAVLFECLPPLRPLLEGVEGIARVVVPGEALPPFAAHASVSSLPRIFGTTLESIPWRGPYIKADPDRAAAWRSLLHAEAAGRFKVGVVWTGNTKATNNRDRSVNLEILARLREVAGTTYYSLQKGDRSATSRPGAASLPVIDHTDRMRDFADTAAFISCLDLVVTIDTAVAHLAGAMGAPVWVLLNLTADWRYHIERSDNPWYPGMRLYRQSHEGQWAMVIDRVAQDLRDAAKR